MLQGVFITFLYHKESKRCYVSLPRFCQQQRRIDSRADESTEVGKVRGGTSLSTQSLCHSQLLHGLAVLTEQEVPLYLFTTEHYVIQSD